MKRKKLLFFNLIPLLILTFYGMTVSVFDVAVLDWFIMPFAMLYLSLGGVYLAIVNWFIMGRNIKSLALSLVVCFGTIGIYCIAIFCNGTFDSLGVAIWSFIAFCQSVSLLITWSIMVIHNKLKQRKTEESKEPKLKSKKIIIILNLLPIFFSIIRTLYVAVSRKIFIFYPLFIFPFEAFYFLLGGIYYTIVNYRLVKKIGKKAFVFSCLSIVLFQMFNLLAFYTERSIESFVIITIYQWITFVISWGVCGIIHRRKAKKAMLTASDAEASEE